MSVRAIIAAEAQRYLATVAVFRAEGCAPQWRPEREPEEPEPREADTRPRRSSRRP